ncbi:prolipoprotein diacylglyceryl transferase family protein [Butyrivibrio sp. VCD2006]|uniref:prolipoprotein diacylglyceryl transferase family protein n=1 Tax=Butyrivibrio sp. VCD2006 TaxID=1280664 RepID=UPI0018CABAC4|nr:prolipoprotein diacylglyceryl transferase family protein [Butyrivibrio sp. VCD2006]
MYRIMILASFILGILVSSYILKNRKIPTRIIIMSLSLELMLSVYLALMVTYLLSGAKGYGLNSTGGAFGMLLGALIFSFITPQYKDAFWNAYTLVLPLMYGLGKIGCSFAGCCGGISYNGICHVHTAEGDFFPIQILEASIFLLIFAMSVFMYLRNRFDPIKAAIIYSLIKILLDFLRASHENKIISTNQVMCMVVIVLLLMIRIREKHGQGIKE